MKKVKKLETNKTKVLTERQTIVLEMFKSGITQTEIAKELGVSRQRINQMVAGYTKSHFNSTAVRRIQYVGLRNWMIQNKVSVSELIRRTGNVMSHPVSHERLMGKLTGQDELRKSTIDRILLVTGLTYEECFQNIKRSEQLTKEIQENEKIRQDIKETHRRNVK